MGTRSRVTRRTGQVSAHLAMYARRMPDAFIRSRLAWVNISWCFLLTDLLNHNIACATDLFGTTEAHSCSITHDLATKYYLWNQVTLIVS
jgi:hypothetical protein